MGSGWAGSHLWVSGRQARGWLTQLQPGWGGGQERRGDTGIDRGNKTPASPHCPGWAGRAQGACAPLQPSVPQTPHIQLVFPNGAARTIQLLTKTRGRSPASTQSRSDSCSPLEAFSCVISAAVLSPAACTQLLKPSWEAGCCWPRRLLWQGNPCRCFPGEAALHLWDTASSPNPGTRHELYAMRHYYREPKAAEPGPDSPHTASWVTGTSNGWHPAQQPCPQPSSPDLGPVPPTALA